MTILNNLILQQIDTGDSSVDSAHSGIQLHDTINPALLERFLDEAVRDMRQDPLWESLNDKNK